MTADKSPLDVVLKQQDEIGRLPRRKIKWSETRRGTGRKNSSRGYIAVFRPEHPRASVGYVLEHLLIAEAAVGRPISKRNKIHHVDGCRSNNENSNLVVCEDNAYHMLLHQRERALKACGNASWRKCRHCQKYDDPANLYINTSTGGTIYHRTCHSTYLRAKKALHVALRTAGAL